MANVIEVVNMIAKESLRILHNELNFLQNCNRGFDDSWDNVGFKIGDSLRIRKPNKFVVGTGRSITPQDVSEETVTITRATQKNVAVSFTSKELTQHIDETGVSERVIKPAMAGLASAIEADIFTMLLDVYNAVGTPGTVPNSQLIPLSSGRRLDEFLAPKEPRTLIVNPETEVSLVNALSSLFNSAPIVSKQYLTGRMKNALGFDWYSNPLVPVLTTGTRNATGALVNGAGQTGSSLDCDGFGATPVTIKKGEIFTIAGVYAVHPETKTAYNYLQQFVVTADATSVVTTGTATLGISPPIVISGAKQNVSNVPADNAELTFAGSPETKYPMNVAFHRDAFVVATAQLPIYKNSEFCVQQTYDGITLRIWKDTNITDDIDICRIDVLYGFKCVYPELACRIWS